MPDSLAARILNENYLLLIIHLMVHMWEAEMRWSHLTSFFLFFVLLVRLSCSSTAVCFLQILGYLEAVTEAEQLWRPLASWSLELWEQL